VPESISVALPVRDGGDRFREVLTAIRAQRVDHPVEIVVLDSGSRDGSVALARMHGARVEEIPPAAFAHGSARNRLMELTSGDVVAFLTQDALPADDGWLAALVSGFGMADDVALVCGPQRARPDASSMVRRELDALFARFGDEPRVDRLAGAAPSPGAEPSSGGLDLGPATFFSSANGAVARWAWERVPFRPVAYAEDHTLAADVLRAGLAKAYVPDAVVIHSHDYAGWGWFRRVFDEFRALHEVSGLREPLSPRFVAARVRNDVAAERAALAREGVRGRALDAATLAALRYHAQRALGRSLGTNADRLPAALRARLSLEGRG
jgi:glycosyltransferase involved in cell wall biosynthesis